MLLGSALFPGRLPAYVLPFVQGGAVAMAVARCHATASLVRAPSPASTDAMVLLLSALGSVGRAALLVCFQRCYFWATSRALAALNGGLLLARVVASLCLESHSSTQLGPEASVLAAASLLVMALAFTPATRRRLAACARAAPRHAAPDAAPDMGAPCYGAPDCGAPDAPPDQATKATATAKAAAAPTAPTAVPITAQAAKAVPTAPKAVPTAARAAKAPASTAKAAMSAATTAATTAATAATGATAATAATAARVRPIKPSMTAVLPSRKGAR